MTLPLLYFSRVITAILSPQIKSAEFSVIAVCRRATLEALLYAFETKLGAISVSKKEKWLTYCSNIRAAGTASRLCWFSSDTSILSETSTKCVWKSFTLTFRGLANHPIILFPFIWVIVEQRSLVARRYISPPKRFHARLSIPATGGLIVGFDHSQSHWPNKNKRAIC